MRNVVFDTNVFVSALITPRGKSASLLLHANRYRLVISRDVVKEGHADYLVTGDREMLDLKRIGRAAIVSPATFLKELEK